MKKTWVAAIGGTAVVLLAFAYSRPGRDLRICWAVTRDANSFPPFRAPGTGLLVSSVEGGIVTLNISTHDQSIESAVEQGHSIDDIARSNPAAEPYRDFDHLIRWREGVRDVRWINSGWTNECP
jgi:hypothetical protein